MYALEVRFLSFTNTFFEFVHVSRKQPADLVTVYVLHETGAILSFLISYQGKVTF
jgi:hypothetical protein